MKGEREGQGERARGTPGEGLQAGFVFRPNLLFSLSPLTKVDPQKSMTQQQSKLDRVWIFFCNLDIFIFIANYSILIKIN